MNLVIVCVIQDYVGYHSDIAMLGLTLYCVIYRWVLGLLVSVCSVWLHPTPTPTPTYYLWLHTDKRLINAQ